MTLHAEDFVGATNGKTSVAAHPRVELTPASTIRSERVRWLWRPRLPLRSLSVVAGQKGLGKSILTNAYLVAQATRGQLDGELEGQPIDVLICTAEDDWKSVVKPRLMAHGADLNRVFRLGVIERDGESLFTLPDHVALLEAEVALRRDEGRVVGMLVIDPIGAFLSPNTDTHRDASVRRALAPLAALADRLDLVVLVVAHLTKDESKDLINRVSGSGAFVNAARSVLVLARSPDDPDGEQGPERVLVHVGSNWGRYAPTIAARVEAREVDLDDGSRSETGYLQITGECDIGLEDLQRGPDESSGSEVEEAIGGALVTGPKPSREVKAQVARELGCVTKTVERAGVRMSKREPPELLITTNSTSPPTTTWALPKGDSGKDPKGTPPDTCTVPFGKGTVPIGFSTSNGDTGTGLQTSVPVAGMEDGQLREQEPVDVQSNSHDERAQELSREAVERFYRGGD